MTARIRPAAVAGYFYSGTRKSLVAQIEKCFSDTSIGPGATVPRESKKGLSEKVEPAKKIECFVVPHAGYDYSGPVAAHAYSKIYDLFHHTKLPVCCVILGPNHYGIGSGISLSPSDLWETPLGEINVDRKVANDILANSNIVDSDEIAHSREHSIEVQLPFLQTTLEKGSFRIVPLCLMLQDKETAREVARTITDIIRADSSETRIVILGSSDLTHYETQERANAQDNKLLEKIQRLDVDSYYTTLERNNVTACGYGAIAVVMEIAKAFGKSKGEILRYATSGDITGDTGSVVGYSAINFV